MKIYWNEDEFQTVSQLIVPVAVKDQRNVQEAENLLIEKEPCLSFGVDNVAGLLHQGAYMVLDFGKEVCGGVRILTRGVGAGQATLRITLGESMTEACSSIGQKNATNDHSPRDFTVLVSNLSDLTFGQSGFRFARIELVSAHTVWLRSVYAVNTLPRIENEGYLTTNDPLLNQIIDTATYTLKLTFQNGYIWDGVKRDRLVWCGDLHPEILSSLYLFGDNKNSTNSLRSLRQNTKEGEWINGIPSYSAWWVINLCDYCSITSNWGFFREQNDYAKEILRELDRHITDDGTMDFGKVPSDMPFFLDWATFGTEDAKIGTAMLIRYAALKFCRLEECETAKRLADKLHSYLNTPCVHKCVRAFQILAGRKRPGDAAFLEAGGAKDLSTFMAYYILKADVMAGGKNALSMLKEYYGGMLSRGATTFWEDFDVEWLNGSGRIDEMPPEGIRDIHGDYGAFCYQGLRHSLCHGWSAGILAFFVEDILGLHFANGGKDACIAPSPSGLTKMEVVIPVPDGAMRIVFCDGDIDVDVPEGVRVCLQSR